MTHARSRLAAAALWGWILAPAGALAQGEGARPLADEERPETAPAAPRGVVTRPPELIEFVEATYPPEAAAAGLEADVQLVLTIAADGSVSDVVLAGPPAGHGFDEAATEAARRFRFRPAEIDGQPATVRVPFTYRFEYTPPPPPEPARVTGRVTDAATGAPVAGARVVVEGAGLEATTGPDGRFALDGLPPGPVDLLVLSVDHQIAPRSLTLAPGTQATADFALRAIEAPTEIVVRGQRERTSLTRRTLEGGMLRTVPGSFGDPLRAVQNLPGLLRAPYIVGVLLVRGASPGDSAIFVDGHEVPIIYHFLGGPSVLPPEMLAGIDFYPGNFSVRFGRAVGGIIDVRTRRAEPEEWHGSADVDLFDAGGFIEGPIGEDTTIAASARRSYIDAVLRAGDAATDAGISTVLPVYYDYQARLDHRLDGAGGRHRLGVLAFGSEDHLSIVGDPGGTGADTDIGARVAFHRLKLDWHAAPSEALEWTLSPVVGLEITTFDGGDAQLDATAFVYGGRFDLRADLAETFTLRTGLDALGRTVVFEAEVPLRIPDYRPYPGTHTSDRETQPLERHVGLLAAAVYAEGEWTPGGGPLTFVPGVRLDTYRYFGRNRLFVDPRMNVRYALTPRWLIKAGAGLFNQTPPEWRLDEEFGNPDLGLEWAEHYGLGVEHRLSEAVSIDLEGFYIRRHDLSERSEAVEVSAGSGESIDDVQVDVERFANTGEGRAYGLELLIKHEVTRRFYGWIAYTLSRAESRPTPDAPWAPVRFDQTHILTAVASYKLGSGWEVGARFRLVSGNPDTPIVGATFDGDRGNYEELRGPENSTRQPLFDQLDVRMEKTWTFREWDLAAYLDVQNVYNANNPEFTTWDYRYRESAPVPGIPILPSFGVKARF